MRLFKNPRILKPNSLRASLSHPEATPLRGTWDSGPRVTPANHDGINSAYYDNKTSAEAYNIRYTENDKMDNTYIL